MHAILVNSTLTNNYPPQNPFGTATNLLLDSIVVDVEECYAALADVPQMRQNSKQKKIMSIFFRYFFSRDFFVLIFDFFWDIFLIFSSQGNAW